MEILLLETLAIGLVLGVLLGLTGAGGSLIALPLLLSLHLSLHDAIGVSLGAVAISSLIGCIPRIRQHQISWTPVVLLALFGLPGNVLGQWLGQFIPDTLLIVCFCLLVLWSAWKIWRNAKLPHIEGRKFRYIPLMLLGLFVGTLSRLLGVGGGFLLVPGLLWLTPLPILSVTATSMAVVTLVSGGGFLLYLGNASPSYSLLGTLATGGAIGVLLGNRLAQRLGGILLQRILALMLLLVALSLAVQKLHIAF